MKLKNCGYIYEPVKMDKRKEILPERNICSIAPAKEWEDAFFTRNGVQKINLLGDPENEIIVFKHEAHVEKNSGASVAGSVDAPDKKLFKKRRDRQGCSDCRTGAK